MSPLKFPFLSVLPRRADRTLLPAVLAGGLAVALLMQIVLPAAPDMPSPLPVGTGMARFAAPSVGGSASPAAIMARPLFAPRQAMDGSGEGGGSAPVLGGASIAGTISAGGRTRAVVRRPNGEIYNIPVGGMISGWRLIGLGSGSARLRKDSQTIDLPFGAQALAPPTDAEKDEENEEE